MDIKTLENKIISADLSPVYLFTGDDVYRKTEITSKIKKVLNADEFNVTVEDAQRADMGEIITLASTAPVFSAQRLIVLKNADKLKKNAKDALLAYLENPLESTVFVLHHNDAKKFKADASLKKAAETKGVSVDFPELKEAALSMWINARLKEKGLSADFNAVELLIENIGADLAALEQEIEKLYLLKGGPGALTSRDILSSVGYTKEENPFALSNAVMACDKSRSLSLVGSMLGSGEEAVGVLNKISSCVLKMLRIKTLTQAGYPPQKVLSSGGLMFWESKYVSAAGRFPPRAVLLRTLDKIIEADQSLKTSSASDPAVLLRGVVMSLFPN